MKFSGHETFPVREGWLHKGMKLLIEAPDRFRNPEVADDLGVGRNMAKSIKHWLIASGLAEASASKAQIAALQPTSVGKLIWQHDRYFTDECTWWILHANLVNNFNGATTWSWSFNSFHHDKFDKAVCLESLARFIQAAQKRVPSPATLNRDLSCMLSSYAREIPAKNEDPEDGADCPFRELKLLSYYRTSGHYHFHNNIKQIQESVFGYVISISYPEIPNSSRSADIRLMDAARKSGGPGRVFGLSAESLFETTSQIESQSDALIQIGGMAGDRTIRIPTLLPDDWIDRAYKLSLENSCV